MTFWHLQWRLKTNLSLFDLIRHISTCVWKRIRSLYVHTRPIYLSCFRHRPVIFCEVPEPCVFVLGFAVITLSGVFAGESDSCYGTHSNDVTSTSMRCVGSTTRNLINISQCRVHVCLTDLQKHEKLIFLLSPCKSFTWTSVYWYPSATYLASNDET